MSEKEIEGNGKVKSLEKKRKEKSIPKASFYAAMADRMIEGRLTRWPDFKHKFRLVVYDNATYGFLEELENGVVRFISREIIEDKILKYAIDNQSEGFPYELSLWTEKDASHAFCAWKAMADPIPEPPPFLEKSTPGLCFHRLDWDIEPIPFCENADTFQTIIKRMSNWKSFCAFIGSLFYPEADRQQYLWIHGHGMDGKGSIIRVLEKVFGRSFHSDDTSFSSNQFFTYSMLGKRLVVFPDTNNSDFPTKQLFKSLCGDDPIRMEPKNKSVFTAKLNCKFIFASNNKPEISLQRSDKRRIIYCEIESKDDDSVDHNFEKNLWNEAREFLGFCKYEYLENTKGKHGPINIDDKSDINELIDESNSYFEYIFNRYFEYNEQSTCKGTEFTRVLKIEEKLRGYDFDKFKKWMKAKYPKIKYQTNIENGKDRVMGYKRLRLLPNHVRTGYEIRN